MKNKGLILALVLSIGLGAYLFNEGRQSDTVTLEDKKEEASAEGEKSEDQVKAYLANHLGKVHAGDPEVDELLAYCETANNNKWLNLDEKLEYGKLKIETSPAPMAGIFMLREILEEDSNHVATIETLAEMSIRSGQLDKAKKRYQKLLSLQPENEAYRTALEKICAELGDSDCF